MSDATHYQPDEFHGLTNSYQSEDQLVVALDFGTTFSGIAYAFANGNKPDVISIMDWPGMNHTSLYSTQLTVWQVSRVFNNQKYRRSSPMMGKVPSHGEDRSTRVMWCKE